MYQRSGSSGKGQGLAIIQNNFRFGKTGDMLYADEIGAVAADKSVTQQLLKFGDGHFYLDRFFSGNDSNRM